MLIYDNWISYFFLPWNITPQRLGIWFKFVHSLNICHYYYTFHPKLSWCKQICNQSYPREWRISL